MGGRCLRQGFAALSNSELPGLRPTSGVKVGAGATAGADCLMD